MVYLREIDKNSRIENLQNTKNLKRSLKRIVQ